MNQHSYGEKVLNSNRPPARPTGLIIREKVYKDVCIKYTLPWFKFSICRTYTYFIFRRTIGSHDYWNGHEEMCGSYTATMGYWHYKTEKERDKKYQELLDMGYEEDRK
jgi:hypothetical protein